jgi:hypothetical protein
LGAGFGDFRTRLVSSVPTHRLSLSRSANLSSFPTAPEELSPQWLTDKLGYDVTSFQVEALGEGGGLLGLVVRLHLNASEGPRTLIAKFPTKTEGNRAVATTYDMYAREYRFYTQVAPNVPMRSPVCYHSELNEQNSDFVLLLEDLQGFELGDQVKGCNVEQAHQVIQSISSLHRNTWQPEQITDIKPHDMPYQRDGMVGGFLVGWPVVKTDFADVLEAVFTPQQIGLIDTMPDQINRLLDIIHDGPLVIGHGDLRLDNIFFSKDGNALVDYQAVSKAAPEHDLAYFVTQSLPDDVRCAEDWVAIYHQHLTSEGLSYPLDTSRERYRYCALYLVCYAVIIAGTLDQANERGRKLAETLLGNSLRSLVELDALKLLSP